MDLRYGDGMRWDRIWMNRMDGWDGVDAGMTGMRFQFGLGGWNPYFNMTYFFFFLFIIIILLLLCFSDRLIDYYCCCPFVMKYLE